MLCVRQDNNGDVILIGPAIRAVAAVAEVDLLCGPRGAAAARLLPGVREVSVWEAGWIDAHPQPIERGRVDRLIDAVAGRYDEAIVFTSFHQSALPMALLLRMAGVPRIGAISVDYPGALLDVRHRVDDGVHEVERALSLAQAMGYALPALDGGRLQLRVARDHRYRGRAYVVVHPGCTMQARTWTPQGFHETVRALARAGFDTIVTGSEDERALTAYVASADPRAIDAGGTTSFAEFAAIVADASAVVSGNTAAAHVAAATATPVVHIFPPTIPFERFAPWQVPFERFGDDAIACAGCRARVCPYDAHPCLRDVAPEAIVDAVRRLARIPELAR